MADRTVQLVLHYDGARFLGWQRQPAGRTVQGELERVFEQLMGVPTPVTGAGRTDSGVHARGQAAHVTVPQKWTAATLRRAANALLPDDLWVVASYDMAPDFHARYSATARRYRYYVGTDPEAESPFRRRYEWVVRWPLDVQALHESAAAIRGEHVFRGFAVRGTAPAHDHHRCHVTTARWDERARGEGYTFEIEANRFLHHMVRFLVATMVDVAAGRRTLASFLALLSANDNQSVSAPAPAHGLFLEHVTYPSSLYRDLNPATA
jgi:tRNA pseudouridine38-40 synthase